MYFFGYKRVYITEDKKHFELARFAPLSDLQCHPNTAQYSFGQFSRFKGQPPILGLAVHESTPKDPAVSLHKQYCLDMDPYMKEYFINCRIPYKLGRTTRWNWERSGNVLPLFFQGLQPGKTGPLSQPGARSVSVWMEIHIICCSHRAYYFTYV